MNISNRKKRKLKRELKYNELNKLFRIKHGIICNWRIKKYTMNPTTIEGLIFNEKFNSFFLREYGIFPHSFNEFASINFSFDYKFDYCPVEKLQELYNKIESIFPDPFIQINRLKKLKNINSIKYEER